MSGRADISSVTLARQNIDLGFQDRAFFDNAPVKVFAPVIHLTRCA